MIGLLPLNTLKRHAFKLIQGKGEALYDFSVLWAFHHKPVMQVYVGTL